MTKEEAARILDQAVDITRPIPLEELVEMDGQKVLLYRMKSTEPLEPGTVKQNGDVLGDAGMLAYHELYLETWVAFTYPPANIDREVWVRVEEKLPTDEHPVLTFVGYADTMTGFITTSSYFCFDANPHWQWDGLTQDEQKTLFWMPLPEPPGKEG